MEYNKIDHSDKSSEEENSETFLKLKNLLDSRGIYYNLMEVGFKIIKIYSISMLLRRQVKNQQ
jgi:hypothetical protein